ncbi:hypothetical protein MTR_2g059230 [Medicago truncatula]|uniref:Uncharacterized protein n=1 Tax=Medicago truncatula TaxID=3880 RepID=G7IT13_MEDTR|nr:hypothetical protein MTR_2g059230 [Medicago truncatula]
MRRANTPKPKHTQKELQTATQKQKTEKRSSQNTVPAAKQKQDVGFIGIGEKKYYGNVILKDRNMFITSNIPLQIVQYSINRAKT